jgi:16S rRNA (guanine527-N7)-methyltransferase
MNLMEALAAGLIDLNIQQTEQQNQALLRFLALLSKWNKTYNLTAIHEPERMLTHHILDSLAVLPYLVHGNLLDVGSGGGFPGIPLAIARPEMPITLMDASQKKCGFMQQAVIELRLEKVTVVHARVESFHAEESYQQIVSRAFSDLSDFVTKSAHLLAAGGQWLAMKGSHPQAEIAQLKAVQIVRDIPLHIPGLSAERCLIIMEPA